MGRVYSLLGCPTLDRLCGGGVPHESIIYIYGGPGLGKTTIALNMVKAMGTGVWVDASHTLAHAYAEVEGVNDMTVIQPSENLDPSTFLSLVGLTPIIVIDDLTALSANLAKPLQAFIKKAKQLLPGSGTTLLFTNQVRQCLNVPKISSMRSSMQSINGYLPPGGLSYTKYSDLVLELGPRHKRVGDTLNVDISIVRSTVGPCQGVRTIPFQSGLARVQDTISNAVKLGIIKQAGSWYSYKESKVQGLNSLELSENTINEIYMEVMRVTSGR